MTVDQFGDYKFSDGEKYCQEWVSMYLLTNSLVYGVPLMIGLVNYGAKLILRFMTHYEKRHSITLQKYSAAVNMMLISFLNVGVLCLLVNLTIQYELPLPIM